MKPRRTAVLILIVAVTSVVVWQTGIAGSAIRAISDTGTPIPETSLPAWQQSLLNHADLAADLRVQHQAPDGVAFYTYKNSAGALCFSAGGSATCPSPGHSLFENAPVADEIRVGLPPPECSGPRGGPLLAWRGIALDGLSQVTVIDDAGKHHSAPVVANTFELVGPISHPKTFEALDPTGKIVWSNQIPWPKC
jgi:hypothetical protein